jgi:hypothetical protein
MITLHPDRRLSGEPYTTFASAIEHARFVALKRGGRLQIWREVGGSRRGYENLTK